MLITQTFEGLATAGASIQQVATTVLATFLPPWKCYLVGATVGCQTAMVVGGTIAGALAVYNGATEIGSVAVATNVIGKNLNVPLTTKATQALAVTDVITLKVKTQPTGTGGTGTVKGYFTVAYDPRETTAVNFGYYHGAA